MKPTHLRYPELMSSPSSNPTARWLKTIFFLTLLLYLLPFALVRIPSFEHWGGSPFGPALDYPFTLAHADADVILFGDSSAVVGIDPRQLSRELGLNVMNLPNTGASLQVLGQSSLDHYLAANQPPRLILFYFAAWNLDYAHEPLSAHLYEGEEVLLRRGTAQQVWRFTRRQPLEMLNFPWRFYLENLPNGLKSLIRDTDPAVGVALAQGYLDPLSRRPALPETCAIPSELLRAVPDTTARFLLEHYRTGSTQVVFTLAPLPLCAQVELLAARRYPALGAEPVVTLPASSFKQDFQYIHLRREAVPANTDRLARLIRAALARR